MENVGQNEAVQQEMNNDAMHELIRGDQIFVPLPDYFQDARFLQCRKTVLESFKLAMDNLPHDPFIYCIAMNIFDCYSSRNPEMILDEEKREQTKSISFASLVHAWTLNNQGFPWQSVMTQLNIKPQFMPAMEKIYREFGEKMEQLGITRPVPTLEFINYLLSILDLKEVLKQAIKHAAMEKIICLTEIDIKYARYRPSVLAAAAVLFSTLQIHPQKISRFKRVILDTCQMLSERDLLRCLVSMSLTCTALMLTSLLPPKDNLQQYERVVTMIGTALERVKVAILAKPEEPQEVMISGLDEEITSKRT
ncbi:hypothetical protein Dsin_022637 [Dipteronia sinensis]|uniref:Cyclin C-terminal domain-containing protein n=1 Tax=Dipteronia sinensis TaxID=43782 RepID=A0AAE0A2U6_9ROSI|nr:hypothetical protein Dsin_022637 [Dipteronia sinensis]